jgi:hypothetical protein
MKNEHPPPVTPEQFIKLLDGILIAGSQSGRKRHRDGQIYYKVYVEDIYVAGDILAGEFWEYQKRLNDSPTKAD